MGVVNANAVFAFHIRIASFLAPRGTVAVVRVILLSRFIFWEMADQLWIRSAEIKQGSVEH